MSKTTYERRKEKGICVICGKENAQKGFVCCEKCKEKQKNDRRETREFLKKIGICPRCGENKLFGDEKECPECLAKMYELNKKYKKNSNYNYKEWYKKDVDYLKKNGLCISCRKKKAAEGKASCERCLIKNKIRAEESRLKKGIIPRSERLSYGLCYFCGNKIDREGKTCSECASRLVKNLPKEKSVNKHWIDDNKLIFMK